MTRCPIEKATEAYHRELAKDGRRREAIEVEVRATLPARIDEIVDLTDAEDALRVILTSRFANGMNKGIDQEVIADRVVRGIIDSAVATIVEFEMQKGADND